jgi:peroxiredoxin
MLQPRIPVIHILLAVAAGLVVILGLKVRTLEEHAASLNESMLLPQPGEYVPTFAVTALSGAPAVIGESPDSGRQVLFVFNTTCRYSEASLPAWQQLAALADTFTAHPVHVYGITLDPADESRTYAASHRLGFEIVSYPAPKLERLYRTRSVPQTLVLDQDGRILFARTGVVNEPAMLDSIVAAVVRR